MTPAVKIALLASGLFLLSGMVTGVWKYARTMSSPEHRAPVYVDIAHRASFFYSFASLVIAKLIEYCQIAGINPYTWLTDTLAQLAHGHPANSVGELMPWAAVA